LDWLKRTYTFDYEWIDTINVQNKGEQILKNFSGIWSAPGGPFKSLEGAIEAIRFARVNNIPHLGTCMGMQHMVIEFARNVLGLKNAQHEEYDSSGSVQIISELQCSLAGKTIEIIIKKNREAFNCYQSSTSIEDYHCSLGINPEFRNLFNHDDFKISGVDQDNEIRVIEIPRNDFFMATLFVPQSRSTREIPHPIIKMFIEKLSPCFFKSNKRPGHNTNICGL